MLSSQAAIRLIADAVTNEKPEDAVETLNEYADHRNIYQESILTIGEHNTGDMMRNLEEIRLKHLNPIPSFLMHIRV